MTLLEAVEYGELQLVQDYLKNNYSQLDQNLLSRALSKAAFLGNLEMVRTLGNYAKMDYVDSAVQQESGSRALCSAIESKRPDMIELLLTLGANINGRDSYGQTPLHIAIDVEIDEAYQSESDQEFEDGPSSTMSEVLIKHGADVNAKTNNGMTPLSWARGRHKKVEQLLTEHGAVE